MSQSQMNPSISRAKLMHLFYPFREEKELSSDFPLMYQIKLPEERGQDVANINKIKFEPFVN